MKSIFSSRRNKSPHNNEEADKQGAPFFGKKNKTPFFHSSNGGAVQTKLKVGQPGDKYEKEADSMADAVVNNSTSKPNVQKKEISSIQRESLATPQEDEKLGTAEQRMEEDKLVQEKPELQKMGGEEEEEGMVSKMEEEEEGMVSKMGGEEEEGMVSKMEGEEEEEALQTKSNGSATVASSGVTQQIKSKSGKGKSLPKNTRVEMEASFGRDFSGVNIHKDQDAIEMNKELGAQAFTHGQDIYFNSGKFNPDSTAGKHLLAHELTHVVQQKEIKEKTSNSLQRQSGSPAAPTTCGRPADCQDPFCTPFPNRSLALLARQNLAGTLLTGIAGAVSPRVVPLWALYLFGGSGPRNISGSFGSDFTNSPTTFDTTTFLVNAIRANLTASPPTFPSGSSSIVIDLSTIIPSEIATINTPGDFHAMNFDVIGDIPGNIAGGIGNTQLSCPVGARPSPFNDARLAKGKVRVTRLPDGSLMVQPFINYKVKDTIDLCPGNCGELKEKVATIPMSMMEASGISGDVPIIVNFGSPPIAPFFVHPPVVPTTGEITASALRIRTAPNLTAPILDKYPRGTVVNLDCQVFGSSVRGNRIWYKTDRGFISGEYVRLAGAAPSFC